LHGKFPLISGSDRDIGSLVVGVALWMMDQVLHLIDGEVINT
jgi:hypothetical protein